MLIRITKDSSLLEKAWSKDCAEKHTGKVYTCLSVDNDGWAITDSAKFPPNTFDEIKSFANPNANAGINVPRYEDVEGAPFKIGAKVKIDDIVDPESFEYISQDPEEVYDKLVHQKGVIVHLDYDCGCGQIFPEEPMFGIKLENGETHEFWPEEIKEIE